MLPRQALAAATAAGAPSQARTSASQSRRQDPRPGGAVVVGRFALRVLVSLVTAPIRLARIVQRAAVGRLNDQRRPNGQGGQRAHRAGHEQMLKGGVDGAAGLRAGEKSEGDGEKKVAAQGLVAGGRRPPADPDAAKSRVGHIALLFQPEEFSQGLSGALRQRRPTVRPAGRRPDVAVDATNESTAPGFPPGSLRAECRRGNWCPSR